MRLQENNRSAWGRSGYLEGGREGEKSGRVLLGCLSFVAVRVPGAGGHASVIGSLFEETMIGC